MQSLPNFVVLKSVRTEKYLRFRDQEDSAHGWIEASGEYVLSPLAKFELVRSRYGNGLVHIKSCYNNKYLVRWRSGSTAIHVSADEAEEDQSQWTCTLFRPEEDGVHDGIIRFMHVQSAFYVLIIGNVQVNAGKYENILSLSRSNVSSIRWPSAFTYIDWQSILVLPKYVAFKGDNGQYLKAYQQRNNHFQFGTDDVGDPNVGNEVFFDKDGNIRLKNLHYGRFWRRDSSSWILGDSSDAGNSNRDTLFWPVKLGDIVVGLRNLGNDLFCRRHTADGLTNGLHAGVSTVSRASQLQVEEHVISRDIFNVNFRTNDARIYDQVPISMATQWASNNTQQNHTMELRFKYRETRTSTWNASLSLRLGVRATFRAGIPIIARGKLEISAEFQGTYEWGETVEETKEMETTYAVIIPPMSSVQVSMIATRGSCDVPFSYTQRDILYNGRSATYDMDDGLYSGVNAFNFRYEVASQEYIAGAQNEPVTIFYTNPDEPQIHTEHYDEDDIEEDEVPQVQIGEDQTDIVNNVSKSSDDIPN